MFSERRPNSPNTLQPSSCSRRMMERKGFTWQVAIGIYWASPETKTRKCAFGWLRGVDLNHRPLGYEPNELPDCSTPQSYRNVAASTGQCTSIPRGASQPVDGRRGEGDTRDGGGIPCILPESPF